MKTITLAAIIIVGSTMCARAGNLGHHHANSNPKNEMGRETTKEKKVGKTGSVSFFTIQQFEQDFPEASEVIFSRGKVFDEVNFKLNEIPYTAFYDDQNNLVGTTTKKSFSDLPRRAQQEINKKYPDYYVDDVILFDDNEVNATDMYLYDTRFADEDNYFVELRRGDDKRIIQVSMSGDCYAFRFH